MVTRGALRAGLSGALLVAACATERISPNKTEPPADLVLRNGAVYTVDAVRRWASAVAVRGGRIAYVGSDSLPAGLIGPGTEVVNLGGKMLMPGFQDAHVHPVESGVEFGVVLDHNLFAIPPGRIHTVKVLRTILEGATIYRAP